MRNKNDGSQWNLIAVYGAAQDEHKQSFLTEIVQCCQNESLPFLMGGDFNIIRGPNEKNNDRYDDRWPSLFNAVINSLDLRELELSCRKFTWANSLPQPTFEWLDRVLVSTEWEFKFPRATIQALPREITSDDMPLLLSFVDRRGASQPIFIFELGWLARVDFWEVVERSWKSDCEENTALYIWQNKIRRLQQFLRGWAKNKRGHYEEEKKELISKLDRLDKKAET